MTVIRVDPQASVLGQQAQGIFDTMHGELVSLVNDVVAVRFFGPNAVAFKTDCGKVAADFANKLNTDMGAMADAVRTSTSNIAASLGGSAITIQIDSKAITPPSPETVDYVDVDTGALESLIPVVTRHFTALRNGLKDNLEPAPGHRLGGQRQDRRRRVGVGLHDLGPGEVRCRRAVDHELHHQADRSRHDRRPVTLIAPSTRADRRRTSDTMRRDGHERWMLPHDIRFDYVASLQLARRLWALADRSNEMWIEPPRQVAAAALDGLARRVRHAVRPAHRLREPARRSASPTQLRARRRAVGGAVGRGDERAELDQLRPRGQAGRGRPQRRRGHLRRHRRPRRPAARAHRPSTFPSPPVSTPPAPSRGTDPMSTTSADPGKLNDFVTGVKAARRQRRDHPGARRLACRRARSPPARATSSVPALGALATLLDNMGENETFVSTVRTELLAADNHDGGPITISDAPWPRRWPPRASAHRRRRSCSTRCRSSASRRRPGSSTTRSARRTAT